MRIDTPPNQLSKRTGYFHVKQMGDDERVAARGKIAPEGIGQCSIGEEFHNYGRVQNNHRASRNARTTCAAFRFAGIGFARWVSSSHSRMVGRSTVRSNSLLMKSERLMPSRAARAFRVLCTGSGTSLTWIIFDML